MLKQMYSADYIVILIFGGIIISASLALNNGIRRYRDGSKEFNLSMLFKKYSFTNSSGTLLIVEAILGLLTSFVCLAYWFIAIRKILF